MRKNMKKLLVVLLAAIMMLPAGAVQAASSTGYVMGEISKQGLLENIVSAGRYQVKLRNTQSLYSRKGKNGKWKKLASGVACFTTNGDTVYYVKRDDNFDSDTDSSRIYSVSVRGGKTKRIKTIAGKSIQTIYCYKNKLYMSEIFYKYSIAIYVYSLKSKKYVSFKRSGGSKKTTLHGAYKEFGLVTNETWAGGMPQALYSVNLNTGKEKRIEKNSYNLWISGKYVYYASYTTDSRVESCDKTFVIKRATVDGKNIKKVTKPIKGCVAKITPHSVQYRTEALGKVKTLKF